MNWFLIDMSVVLGLVLVAGCSADTGAAVADAPPADHGHDHGSAHSHVGPRGGTLIDLGNDAYHAELVRDADAGQFKVFLLDANATQAAPIDAASLTINLRHHDANEQFEIAAEALADDPEGKSSCFVSSEEELIHALDHDHAQGSLVVMIDGKQYRGEFGHAHDSAAQGEGTAHDHDGAGHADEGSGHDHDDADHDHAKDGNHDNRGSEDGSDAKPQSP